MRIILFFALTAALVGCRTTHEADADELADLGLVDGALQSPRGTGDDQGQSSLGLLAGVQAPLRALSEDEQDSTGLGISNAQFADLMASARFANVPRDEWPDCVNEDGDTTTYANCELTASGGSASISFAVDGSYSSTDNSSTADLTYDLDLSAGSIGFGTSLEWGHDLAWTDVKLDGEFNLEWAFGIDLGTLPTATGASFTVDATIEELLTDDECDGPISGLVDWRSVVREGSDPPDVTRVTVEWTACGEALITQ